MKRKGGVRKVPVGKIFGCVMFDVWLRCVCCDFSLLSPGCTVFFTHPCPLSRGELSSVLTRERFYHSASEGFLLGLGVVECHLTGKDLGGHFGTVRTVGQVLDHLRVDDASHLLYPVNGAAQTEL